jgi:hypothetical protein
MMKAILFLGLALVVAQVSVSWNCREIGGQCVCCVRPGPVHGWAHTCTPFSSQHAWSTALLVACGPSGLRAWRSLGPVIVQQAIRQQQAGQAASSRAPASRKALWPHPQLGRSLDHGRVTRSAAPRTHAPDARCPNHMPPAQAAPQGDPASTLKGQADLFRSIADSAGALDELASDKARVTVLAPSDEVRSRGPAVYQFCG